MELEEKNQQLQGKTEGVKTQAEELDKTTTPGYNKTEDPSNPDQPTETPMRTSTKVAAAVVAIALTASPAAAQMYPPGYHPPVPMAAPNQMSLYAAMGLGALRSAMRQQRRQSHRPQIRRVVGKPIRPIHVIEERPPGRPGQYRCTADGKPSGGPHTGTGWCAR
jgi:hypothetical protein